MRWIILMLTVWLTSACAAQLTSGRAMPMAMFQIPPTKTVQQVREVSPSPIQFTEPEATPLTTLAQQDFSGPFMLTVSCYDFGSRGAVGAYDPCGVTGPTPEPNFDGHFPRLCIEPTLMGSTFSPAMRCSDPIFGVDTHKYSLVKPGLWHFLLRKAAQDAEQKDP